MFLQEDTPQQAIARFESELKGFSPSKVGSRYGLVLALIDAKEFAKANLELAPLLREYPQQEQLISAQVDIEAGNQQVNQAMERLQQALNNKPDNYALSIHYSRLLASTNQTKLAAQVLSQLGEKRPNDPAIWYHLAEFSGLAGDILTLHKARAEYFMLYGKFDEAENQLNNLLKKFGDNKKEVGWAKQRLKDLKQLRDTSML